MAYHTATLPLTRLQMERLARVPHKGLKPLPLMMTPEEAATPSPF